MLNKSVLYIIGVLVLLLTFSFVLEENTDLNNTFTGNETNEYLEPMPINYINSLSNTTENDSTFFSALISENGIRELIVFKLFPNHVDDKADFEINLFPSDDSETITLLIENDAASFNHDGKTYGVFRKALPFINLNKIEIKRKVLNKWQLKWDYTYNNPFKSIELGDINFADNPVKHLANPYTLLFLEELNRQDISYLPYSFTIKGDSLYQAHESLNKFITSNDLTIGTALNTNAFAQSINNKTQPLEHIKFTGNNSNKANALIESYIKGEIVFDELFDLDKTTAFFAVSDIYLSNNTTPLYFLFNTDSNLLEPFYVFSNNVGKMGRFLEKPKFSDLMFINKYIEILNTLYQEDIYQKLIAKNKTFENQLSLINEHYPYNIFDYDVLKINQRIIRESLNNLNTIKPELISIDKRRIILSIENRSNYPVYINSLNYISKTITTLSPRHQLLSGVKDTLVIELPRSFENLFVSKKNKVTGFLLHKHIYDLHITYSTAELDKSNLASIQPYQKKEDAGKDLFRDEALINNHEDIVVDNNQKTITFKNESVTIKSPLVIPRGYTFFLKQGTIIDIVKDGKIISQSPLQFSGTKEKPIKIFSSDKKGQGLLVLSEDKQSELNFVTFSHLRNPVHDNWSITGAVTFYESPVALNNVIIEHNKCEDALNIVRTNFTINECKITNTQSDAFDGDFVTGTVTNSVFDNLGNDAIDVSGSDLIIKDVFISYAGDKGLSAGEDSKMTINNVEIVNSEIGLAGKDLSIINVKGLKISNTKLGFTAFQKKPEFGPSNIIAFNITLQGVETNYLIENTSSLFVDGKRIESSENVKGRMYGVEFGVSSDDTRNIQ